MPIKQKQDHVNPSTFIDSIITTFDVCNELSIVSTAAPDSFETASFDQIIEQSSTAIELLSNRFIDLLEIRVKTWAKKGNTVKELEDALTMIRIAPNCPTGYHRTGTLYANQGYQERAINILEKGLVHVPANHPQYTLLQKQLDRAQMRLKRRIDFFASCPRETALLIIDVLPTEDLYECTLVTRAWRQLITSYYSRWKTFVLSVDEPHLTKLLPIAYPYIQNLKLEGAQDFIQKKLIFIQMHEFSRIQSLSITNTTRFPYIDLDIYQEIVNTLPSIENTLKSLILCNIGNNTPSLATIMSTCRNYLTAFEYADKMVSRWFFGLTMISNMPLLTKVVLSSYDFTDRSDSIPTDEISSLIRCAPALEHIYLDGCDCYDLLPIIEQHCSKLRQLWLNKSKMGAYYSVEYPVNDNGKSPNVKDNLSTNGGYDNGLEHLQLCGAFPSDGAIIARLLKRSHNSLRSLYLAPNAPRTTLLSTEQSIYWENTLSATLTMPLLKKLYIEQPKEQNGAIRGDMITHLIHQSPNLSDVILLYFQGEHTYLSNDIVGAVARLNHLEYLKLERSHIPSESFLCQLVTGGCRSFSSLVDLCVNICSGVTDELLQSITRIQSLNSIEIKPLTAETTPEGIYEFTKLLAQLSHLNEISLYKMKLDDKAIENLYASKSLIEAHFTYGMISKDAVNGLLHKGLEKVAETFI